MLIDNVGRISEAGPWFIPALTSSLMPTLTPPSTFNVSAWPRKMGDHPRGHVAVFGDNNYHGLLYNWKCASQVPKKKKISIPEEIWLGHAFRRDTKNITHDVTDQGMRSVNLGNVGTGNSIRKKSGVCGKNHMINWLSWFCRWFEICQRTETDC